MLICLCFYNTEEVYNVLVKC